MPIKPENKHRYPKDWKEIRERILERANNCCEFCTVKNGSTIARGCGIHAGTYMYVFADFDFDSGQIICDKTGALLGQVRLSEYEHKKFIVVILTIMHLDHIPEHCDDDNLKAGCQKCHLTYDAKHHAETARNTRREGKVIKDMFDVN